MKNPILEHVHLFAKGLIVTVGIFVLTIFISDFYEKHLLNIMPVCVTWILSVFTILWPFIGLTITLVKSIRFIIKVQISTQRDVFYWCGFRMFWCYRLYIYDLLSNV